MSEGRHAGNAMNRRLFFQYGLLLPATLPRLYPDGASRQVSASCRADVATAVEGRSRGIRGRGLKMVFQNTPNTEAAGMNTYISRMKALWRKTSSHSLHNIYLARRAGSRSVEWSKYIGGRSIASTGSGSDVCVPPLAALGQCARTGGPRERVSTRI